MTNADCFFSSIVLAGICTFLAFVLLSVSTPDPSLRANRSFVLIFFAFFIAIFVSLRDEVELMIAKDDASHLQHQLDFLQNYLVENNLATFSTEIVQVKKTFILLNPKAEKEN